MREIANFSDEARKDAANRLVNEKGLMLCSNPQNTLQGIPINTIKREKEPKLYSSLDIDWITDIHPPDREF